MSEIKTVVKEEVEKKIEEEINNFKKFALKATMIETAIAFVVASSFSKIVNSLVDNIIMPFVSYFADTVVDWRDLKWELTYGPTVEIGKFLGSVIDFVIVAIVLYIIYTKIMKFNIEEDKK